MCTSPKAAPQLQQTGVGCCYSVKLNLARRCERLFERHATPRRALRVCDSRPICQRQRLLFWPCTPCLTCGAWERFAFSLHRHTRFLLTVPVAPLQLTTDAVKRCARSLVLELSFASGYAVSWIVGCLCAGFGKWTLRMYVLTSDVVQGRDVRRFAAVEYHGLAGWHIEHIIAWKLELQSVSYGRTNIAFPQREPQRLSALYQYHNAPEVAPAHGLEYDDTIYPSSDKYPVVRERAFSGSGKYGFSNNNHPPMIIFGMKVRTFLLVASVMTIVVVGAAVGGAVGGQQLRENQAQTQNV